MRMKKKVLENIVVQLQKKQVPCKMKWLVTTHDVKLIFFFEFMGFIMYG